MCFYPGVNDFAHKKMTQSISLRNIRMLVETDDPMYFGKKKLKVRGRDLVHLSKDVFKLMDLEVGFVLFCFCYVV